GLAGARLRFDGTASALSADGRFAGALKVEGSDLRALGTALTALAGSTVPMPGFAAQGFTLEGRAEAGAERGLAIADLALRLGDSRAGGALDVRLDGKPSRVGVKIDRIDLDKWAALERDAAANAEPPAPPAAPVGFYLPRAAAGTLDLSIGTAVWNAQALRDVTLSAALADGTLTVGRLSAALPGDGTLAIDGSIVAPPRGTPRFSGQIRAAAANAGATASWLGLAPAGTGKAKPVRVAGSAMVDAAGLLLVPGSSFRVTKLELGVAELSASGEAEYVMGPRPRWRASAAIDTLDLDALAAGGGAGAAGGPGALLAPVFRGESGDGAVRLAIGQARLRGTTAQGLYLDAATAPDGITINEARADRLWGASMRASGGLRGGFDQPSFAGQVAVRAEDAAPLFAAIGLAHVKGPGRLVLAAEGRAGLDALQLQRANLEALGSTLDLAGRIERPFDDNRRFDLKIAGGAIELDRALALMGTTPAQRLGRFQVKGHVAGGSDKLTVDGELGVPGAVVQVKGDIARPLRPDRAPALTLKGHDIDAARLVQALPGLLPASFAAAGRIGLDATIAKSAIDARLALLGGEARIAGEMPPAPKGAIKVAASFPEGQNALRAFVPGLAPPAPIGRLAVQASVQAAPGGYAMHGFSVDSAPLALSGDITLVTTGARPKLTGRLEATRPLALDQLVPRTAAAPRGAALWPTDPIDLAALQRIDSDLRLSAPRVSTAALTLERPSGRLVLADGVGELSDVVFTSLGAQVSLRARIDARAAPAVSGSFRVEHFPVRDFLVGLKMESSKVECTVSGRQCTIGIIGGVVDGTGTFQIQGRSLQELLSRLDGGFTFKLRNLVIDGLDLRALGRRLKQTGLTNLVPKLVLATMFTGRTTARDIDGEIVASNGSVTLGRRVNNQFSGGGVEFLADGARMLVPGNVNLASGAYIFEPRIDLTDPNDAPQFGLEVKGRLLDPRGAVTEMNTGRIEKYIMGRP
ncbi:MAG: AsmA family protein, partial [Alphaproteobacteria bacterium]|nr:AsmA family protein [Alphaproteobacteria bacterium]